MIGIAAIGLAIAAGIVAIIELVREDWQSLQAWGLLVLVLSVLAGRMA